MKLFLSLLFLGSSLASPLPANEYFDFPSPVNFGNAHKIGDPFPCPSVKLPILEEERCANSGGSTCWNPSTYGIDCANQTANGCCFNGCINECIEAPEGVTVVDVPVDAYEVPCEQVFVNVTEYVDKEMCTTENVDECEITFVEDCSGEKCNTVYDTVAKPVTETQCWTETETQCSNEPDTQCHTESVMSFVDEELEFCEPKVENVCETETNTECETVYDHQCEDVPVVNQKPVTTQECNEVFAEECSEVPDQECHTTVEEIHTTVNVTQCMYTIVPCVQWPHEYCTNETETNCKTVTRLVEKVETKQECHFENKVECTTTVEEVCTGNKWDSYVPYECKPVEKETCVNVPHEVCNDVEVIVTEYVDEEVCTDTIVPHCYQEIIDICPEGRVEETCHEVPEEKVDYVEKEICEDTTRTKCNNVPTTECHDVTTYVDEWTTEEICKEVSSQVCHEVPHQVCHDQETEVCENRVVQKPVYNDEQICETVEVEVCKDVPVERCDEVTTYVEEEVANEECETFCFDKPVENCTSVPKEKCEIVSTPMHFQVIANAC